MFAVMVGSLIYRPDGMLEGKTEVLVANLFGFGFLVATMWLFGAS
jgi:hypothetical protein